VSHTTTACNNMCHIWPAIIYVNHICHKRLPPAVIMCHILTCVTNGYRLQQNASHINMTCKDTSDVWHMSHMTPPCDMCHTPLPPAPRENVRDTYASFWCQVRHDSWWPCAWHMSHVDMLICDTHMCCNTFVASHMPQHMPHVQQMCHVMRHMWCNMLHHICLMLTWYHVTHLLHHMCLIT